MSGGTEYATRLVQVERELGYTRAALRSANALLNDADKERKRLSADLAVLRDALRKIASGSSDPISRITARAALGEDGNG